jgi:hypothetical protein
MKLLCKCGKLAVWSASSYTGEWCDDCVPRGCSCNAVPPDNATEETINTVQWVEELDEKGRKLPCCEIWFDKDGWEE